MKFEKVVRNFRVLCKNEDQEEQYYAIMFDFIKLLFKDRLLVVDMKDNDYCKLMGLNRYELRNSVQYCTGLKVGEFVQLVRTLDCMGLAMRQEGYKDNVFSAIRKSNASKRITEDVCKSVKGVFFSTLIKGLESSALVTKSGEFRQKNINNLRLDQLKRSYELLDKKGVEYIKSI